MTTQRRLLLMLAVPLLFVATACAQPRAGSTHPFAPDDLVIRVVSVGGLTPTVYRYAGLPVVSVYGDGRVITEGPVPAIYPGPALPNLQVRRISEADVHDLVQHALDAGVGDSVDLGTPNVMDAPSTRFDVLTDRGLLTTEVAALGIGGGSGDGLTSSQRAARAKLSSLLTEVTGAGAGAASTPYEAVTVAALAEPYTPDPQLPAPPAREWTGPPLPGLPVAAGAAVTCVTVAGAGLYPVARQANALTPWTSAGRQWKLYLRPLLPNESTCADLGR